MTLRILTEQQALASLPPKILIYSAGGIGKTTLAGTVIEAGLTPLWVNTENAFMKADLVQRIYAVGGEIVVAEHLADIKASQLAKLLEKKDCMVVDGFNDLILHGLIPALLGASDTRGVYGSSREMVLSTLYGLRAMNMILILTCHEKWDKLFAGVGKRLTKDTITEEAPTAYRYMPSLSGKLEYEAGDLFADIVGRLVLDNSTDKRTLLTKPTENAVTKNRYRLVDIEEPTVAKLISTWPGRPQERWTDEETQKHMREDK